MSTMTNIYKEITLELNADTSTLWVGMKPVGRQCFTLSILSELLHVFHRIDQYGALEPSGTAIRYVVLESTHPHLFNTGGDLQHFSKLIQQNNAKGLKEYGTVCIDLIHWALTGGKRNITTIANVAGDALGGGFEAALACNYMIAEEQSNFAFPESLFGFFPGMGGYDLLARYAGAVEADTAVITGKRYSAKQLQQFGAIYKLTKKGGGRQAVKTFIEERESNPQTHGALQKLKQRSQNISYETLEFSIDLWVEVATKLTKKNLRVMNILTKRQLKQGVANKLTPNKMAA